MSMENEQPIPIEQAFEELTQIVETLEKNETDLAESIALYGKGMTLLGQCKSVLDDVEKEIIVIGRELDEHE